MECPKYLIQAERFQKVGFSFLSWAQSTRIRLRLKTIYFFFRFRKHSRLHVAFSHVHTIMPKRFQSANTADRANMSIYQENEPARQQVVPYFFVNFSPVILFGSFRVSENPKYLSVAMMLSEYEWPQVLSR